MASQHLYSWMIMVEVFNRRKIFLGGGGQQPKSGLGHLTAEVSRSDTIRHSHLVIPLWTSDQLILQAATYTTQQTWETNIHALSRIQTHNLSNQGAADLRLWLHSQ